MYWVGGNYFKENITNAESSPLSHSSLATDRFHYMGVNSCPVTCSGFIDIRSSKAFPSSSLGLGEGNGTPLQYSCLENPMDGGAWWAAVHGVTKSQTRLSNFTCTFHFHALEKEMATHSCVLAWRTTGMAVPGGLPSMGVAESDTTEAT